ncbi:MULTISPECIES: ATP-binding protein [unclassified Pseudoalteromonas]|uniref:ATP-binding protein n=1 Tax=unclassified Pseudoalteromonas TaxID=194690 RepID=UPI000CF66B09|nr:MULTISPECIES: ATP-binding protein [unclassified Pseudoalteromonas]MBS3796294.1 ATP-binding protein [Pseudoalteromonas sp. BDTF-M6]
MGKLFVSLYLYIIVSLVIATGAIERLWPADEQSTPLAMELGNNFKALAQSELGRQYINSQYPMRQLQRSDIALPEQVQVRLEQAQAVHVFDADEHLLWYVPLDNEQLLQIGPVELPKAPGENFVGPYLLVLLLVGAPVGLWSLMLWRDFNKLSETCAQVDGRTDINVSNMGRSFLLPITDALQVMQRRIHSLLNAQRELTSSVSHEFRTPLARLKFALAMLEQGSDEKQQKYMQSMTSDITELENLVSEMLHYARLDAQGPTLALELVDLNELVDNMVEKLNFDSKVHIEVLHEQPNLYRCDPHFLARALQNLLGNALKHARHHIQVRICSNEEQCDVCIEDDGAGIAPSKRADIFKPFIRLDQSRAKSTGGYGLGLAITAKIVQWHHGKISVDSSALGGAKFVMSLPQPKSKPS